MNKDIAKRWRDSVADFYEKCGASFSRTRTGPWPEMLLVAKRLEPKQTVVDIGAGNGRFFHFLPEGVIYLGFEPSLALRTSSDVPLREGAFPHIPTEEEIADAVVSFAVFHHLVTNEDRKAAVDEMIRIAKPNGRLVASAWRIDPSAFSPVEGAGHRDVWVPWRADGEGKRFVHAFTEEEWRELFTRPDIDIEQIGYFGKDDWTDEERKARNFFVIAKKRTT